MKLLYTLFFAVVVGFSAVLAQSPSKYGGAGFFRVGQANLRHFSQALDPFEPPNQPNTRNNFLYMGGEGYARFGKNLVGGGGYALARRSVTGSNYHAEPFSGGGYLHYGRIVLDRHRFWLYPSAGIGFAIVGLAQSHSVGAVTTENSVMLPNFSGHLGIGTDWMVAAFGDKEGYGGLLLGLRAGYQFSPWSSGWRTEGELSGSEHPRYAINGFYATLAIGAGGFRK